MGFVVVQVLLTWMAANGWWLREAFTMNYRVFAGGLFACVVFGVLTGVYPAWRMSRLHPAQALRGGPG